MYVIMRKDLSKISNFTAGSILAQASHGCCKLLWIHRDNPLVQAYMNDPNDLTKVVLSVKNENQLQLLSKELMDAGFINEVWNEKPECKDMCLVTLPYEPEEIRPFLGKRCSLYT
jgi:peptidyl-tRNA hydrolase